MLVQWGVVHRQRQIWGMEATIFLGYGGNSWDVVKGILSQRYKMGLSENRGKPN